MVFAESLFLVGSLEMTSSMFVNLSPRSDIYIYNLMSIELITAFKEVFSRGPLDYLHHLLLTPLGKWSPQGLFIGIIAGVRLRWSIPWGFSV